MFSCVDSSYCQLILVLWYIFIRVVFLGYLQAELFTYSHFKEKLVSLLQKDDCLKLINHFAVLREQSNEEWGSTTPATALLLALEEKGMIDTSNIDRLADALASLDIEPSCYHIAEIYQKTRSKCYVQQEVTLFHLCVDNQ